MRVGQDYLYDLACELSAPGVGLVTSPIRAMGGSGIGAKLEALNLHTFVTGGACAANMLFHTPVTVGKSMAFTKKTLERIGGWKFLGQYLAEDQMFAQSVRRIGKRVTVGAHVIDNTLGAMALSNFVARHERWGILRKNIAPAAYIGELLFNPTTIALIGLVGAPSLVTLAIFGGAWLGKILTDRASERRIGVKRSIFEYLWLSPLKELSVLYAWLAGLLQSTASWRGRSYRVGRQSKVTLLTPEAATQGAMDQPLLSHSLIGGLFTRRRERKREQRSDRVVGTH